MAESHWIIAIHLGLITICLYPVALRRDLRSTDPGGRFVWAIMIVGILAIGGLSFFPRVLHPNDWELHGSNASAEAIRNTAIFPTMLLPLLLITPIAERRVAREGRDWKVFPDLLGGYMIYATAVCIALYGSSR